MMTNCATDTLSIVYARSPVRANRLRGAHGGRASIVAGRRADFREALVVARKKRGRRRRARDVPRLSESDQSLIDQSLAGDSASITRLVDRLTPVIQARVARRLLGLSASRDVRQDVKDLTQDIFLHLLENGGRVLKGWDPERGMSLENYVGLIAERRAISHLRSGKSNPWRESGNLEDVDEPSTGSTSVDGEVMTSDFLQTVLARMREALSPLGWRLFELLYIAEKSIDEVKNETDMSADAIYAWRSRLRKLARQCQQELLEDHGG